MGNALGRVAWQKTDPFVFTTATRQSDGRGPVTSTVRFWDLRENDKNSALVSCCRSVELPMAGDDRVRRSPARSLNGQRARGVHGRRRATERGRQ